MLLARGLNAIGHYESAAGKRLCERPEFVYAVFDLSEGFLNLFRSIFVTDRDTDGGQRHLIGQTDRF